MIDSTMDVPARIVSVIYWYIKAHREDILTGMEDFGQLRPVLEWLDLPIAFSKC